MNDDEVDLFGDPLPAPGPGAAARGRRGAVPAAQWQQWIDDEHLVARYRASIYWRGEDACAYWLGSLSSSAHGKFRLGSRSDGSRRVVTAHVFGYQCVYGVLADDVGDAVVGHRCDQPPCQNPRHWDLTTRAGNDADYRARKNQWPLTDVRGARGRAVALRDAILAALAEGKDVEAAIAAADAAGRPAPPTDVLF